MALFRKNIKLKTAVKEQDVMMMVFGFTTGLFFSAIYIWLTTTL